MVKSQIHIFPSAIQKSSAAVIPVERLVPSPCLSQLSKIKNVLNQVCKIGWWSHHSWFPARCQCTYI